MNRRSPRGTVGNPYSALNLRLALTLFGVASMLGLAALALWWAHSPVIAIVCLAGAVVAGVNATVVQRRRRERQRREHGAPHSMFE